MHTDPVLQQWDQELERLERDNEKLDIQAQQNKERMDRIRIAREEYLKLPRGEGAPPVAPAEPRRESGDDRLLRLMRSHVDRDFSDEEAMALMVDAGWTSESSKPISIIKTYLSRLYRRGDLVRPSRGRYQAKAP